MFVLRGRRTLGPGDTICLPLLLSKLYDFRLICHTWRR
ncbi:hypothetical protein MTATph1_CDS0182 [Moorella phage MTATph1]